jgi:hypothetical protein
LDVSEVPPSNVSTLTPEQRLARLTEWLGFLKFLTGSVAVVVFTAILGHLIKEREQALKEVSQDNANLQNYVNIALDNSSEKQLRLAEYFKIVSRDSNARSRWEQYYNRVQELRANEEKAKTAVAEKQRAVASAPADEKEKAKRELNEAITNLESASALAAPPGVSDPKDLVGSWNWEPKGQVVTIYPDGTATSNYNVTATWKQIGTNSFVLRWSNGFIDTLVLSRDGKTLGAVNQYGGQPNIYTKHNAGQPSPSPAAKTEH